MSDRRESKPGLGRRKLIGALGAVAAGAAGGVAGVAAGYRFRTEIRGWKLAMQSYPLVQPAEADEFRDEAARITARHDAQTEETVAALTAKYQTPVFGSVRVWDLVDKLGLCVDRTDRRLFCSSQHVHLQQILAAMERNGVKDPDMLLLAVVHDLGKVLLLAGESPEYVVGTTGLIAEGEPGAGLDQSVFQYGHGEFIHSRIKGYVPEHVAWVARYHNVNESKVAHLMSEREREWSEKYLMPFKRFDGQFASPYYLPHVDMTRYRELIESTFPSPLLV